MNENNLNSISPIDGRYFDKTKSLKKYFSEKALIYYRLKVEIEYFIALCKVKIPQLNSFNQKKFEDLKKIYLDFSIDDAIEIKEIEKVTNHDVKAVEYFLRQRFDKLGISEFKEFIHFGLTSQDINNTAIPLSIKEFINDVYLVKINELLSLIEIRADDYKNITIISRTHGQPASPTKLGKEFMVFWTRINEQLKSLKQIPNSAKFAGAVGNFNAHKVAYPNINWKKFAKNFVEKNLSLNYSYPTTQIEHYDSFASLSDNCRRINNILLDMCQDIWSYISHDYFHQKIVDKEVGSSAMPHKVNPIDFENAEKTGQSYYNYNLDIENNWIVISEAIQTILRREGFEDPYEIMKHLTRKNSKLDKESIHRFIDNLDVNNNIKLELKEITPYNYTGIDYEKN